MTPELVIIGGGLAGSEAAWQAANSGIRVLLYEMRPERMTDAHTTGNLAELVCSNSLKSNELTNAHGLLKEEMRRLGSLIISIADRTRIPSGSALAVDRNEFSRMVTEAVASHPCIKIIREEVSEPLCDAPAIIATGPLTSVSLTDWIRKTIGDELVYFYDAISPIISSDSINMDIAFRASRYDKGGADYLNCPMERGQYENFYNALIRADKTPDREFEKIPYFEGCMPVEALAERGIDTLLYGPMKPVGLKDPVTGKQPCAVVQLRQEDRYGQAYNMVGFQTRIKWPAQARVFRMIPGLEQAEFLRYGSLHRNTFINSPLLLDRSLRLKKVDNIYMAGQITGVEGYIESASSGLLAGLSAALYLKGKDFIPPPETTCMGALLNYITSVPAHNFQPMNINMGLLPPLSDKIRNKDMQRKKIAERALKDIEEWKRRLEDLQDISP